METKKDEMAQILFDLQDFLLDLDDNEVAWDYSEKLTRVLAYINKKETK